MILPKHLPDETLCSLLARLGRLNGVTDFRDIAAIYCVQPICPSFIDAPIDLPGFCRRTRYVYGDPKAVLDKLTWYVAQARLGEREIGALRAIEQGGVRPTLSALSFDDSALLCFCLNCVEEDIGRFGVAYWHRIHQSPIVRCCPHHGGPVVKVKIKRASLHHSFPLPGDFVSQEELMTFSEGDLVTPIEKELAATAYEILRDPNAPQDAGCVSSTFIDELRRRKVLTAGGALRAAESLELLRQRVNRARGTSASDEQKMLARLIRGLTEPGDGIALERTVLVQCLFGSWKAFCEKLCWTKVFGVQEVRQSCMNKPLPNPQDLGVHHRQLCETFIREHPNCSRLDFTKAEYRSFRWLLHNDKEWLDSQLAVPARGYAQLALF